MSRLIFTEKAWADYVYWQTEDKKTLRRINLLLKDISRSGFEGIGKPEPLKHNEQGKWSRRIDEENRLVYSIENGEIIIYQCKEHYSD